MMKQTSQRLRKLAMIPILTAGIIALIALTSTRDKPSKRELDERGRRVRVLSAEELTVTPSAIGYGVVQAQREWQMIAQVSGQVVEIHPDLRDGSFVSAGTELIKIDPEDFELAEAQLEANVKSVEAQIRELKIREASARKSLEIESRSLELAEKELGRQRELHRGGASPAATVDREERSFLAQKKVVQNLRNSLSELPASRKVLEAQIEQQEAGLKGATRNVARTGIVAPYDVRIREVRTSLREAVQSGQVLATADGLDIAEIPAQFSIGALRPVLSSRTGASPLSIDAMSQLPELTGLEATVRLESQDVDVDWEAKFDRFTSVDPKSRTVGVVLTISDPYADARPGERPPIISGMYVEVELRGRPRTGCLAVPRSALHGNTVYVANADQRLERREVVVDYRQAEFVCVREGISSGDKVILTDIVPVIEGMLLDPVEDEAAKVRLRSAPHGEATAR